MPDYRTVEAREAADLRAASREALRENRERVRRIIDTYTEAAGLPARDPFATLKALAERLNARQEAAAR